MQACVAALQQVRASIAARGIADVAAVMHFAAAAAAEATAPRRRSASCRGDGYGALTLTDFV